MQSETTFVSLPELAERTGLTASWLKDEAEAGRIPFLRTGRRVMFHPGAVERVLLERAQAGTESGVAHA